MKLQDILNRAEAIDAAIFKDAYEGSETCDGFLSIRQKLSATKYREQIASVQADCGTHTGHAYMERAFCVICGHDATTAQKTLSANLLKTA